VRSAIPTTGTRAGVTSTSTSSSPRRTLPRGWLLPPRPRRISSGGEPSGGRDPQTHSADGSVQAYHTRSRRFASRSRRTGRRCNYLSRTPRDFDVVAAKDGDTVFEGHGILGWGVPTSIIMTRPPTAKDLRPWWQYKPAEANKLLTDAATRRLPRRCSTTSTSQIPPSASGGRQDSIRTSTSTSRINQARLHDLYGRYF